MEKLMEKLIAKTKSGLTVEVTPFINSGGEFRGKILAGGKEYFCDFAIVDGVPAVRLSKSLVKEIFGIKIEQSSVCVAVSDWRPVKERVLQEHLELVKKVEPTGFVYRRGCDAESQYYFEYETPDCLLADAREALEMRWKKLLNAIKKLQIDDLAEKLGAEELDGDGRSYYGYRFDAEQTKELILQAQQQKEEKQEDKKFEEAVEMAKRTGKKQLLDKYDVYCDGSVDECSVDIIEVWVFPSGKIVEERIHTY